MFNVELTSGIDGPPFNRHLPIFNWPYPFDTDNDFVADSTLAYRNRDTVASRRRAVYIHIPFCSTICNFCPFSRDVYRSEEDTDTYLNALILEMELKHRLMGRFPVDAIFVGGGTPSLLSPRQIERLGAAIEKYFSVETLKEFTFEVEVKSVAEKTLATLHDIGVNRISFGAQTFSRRYRSLFHMDATIEQVVDAAAMINSRFEYTNTDLLYGMAGQTRDEVEEDMLSIVELGTTTIDVYPINNLSASNNMHRAIGKAGLDYLSAAERMSFRRLLTERLRELQYAPISGYGFARIRNDTVKSLDPVQHQPKFLYHDLVYGHHDDEIVGYGSSAFSRLPGYNFYNFSNRKSYVRTLLGDRSLPQLCYGEIASPERGIVSFPFRGTLDKSRVPWNRVPEETLIALQDLVEANLVLDENDKYILTENGWHYYVNLMYYLMPAAGKQWVSSEILRLESLGRRCGDSSLSELERPMPALQQLMEV
jgi:oxygen-independent coproporphyrinogen-3 oxidase